MFAQFAACLKSHGIRFLSFGFLDQGDQLYLLAGEPPNAALPHIRELVAKIRAKEIEVNQSYDDNDQHLYSVVVERMFKPHLGVMVNGITIQFHDPFYLRVVNRNS